MTRTFSDGHPKVLPACNFLSQYYFCNIFLQKSCRFSLPTLTKFEAAKTGSGVGFLRLTAVWLLSAEAPGKKRYVRELQHGISGILSCERCGGPMVCTLDSTGPGSSPGRENCVVFLGKTLCSRSASLHPGISMTPANLMLGVTLRWIGILEFIFTFLS